MGVNHLQLGRLLGIQSPLHQVTTSALDQYQPSITSNHTLSVNRCRRCLSEEFRCQRPPWRTLNHLSTGLSTQCHQDSNLWVHITRVPCNKHLHSPRSLVFITRDPSHKYVNHGFRLEYLSNKLQQFPPPLMPVSVTLTPSSGANPWQHHHYISPSSAASFPQSQDRYICQTCNKAFSRPSSLRIHSHSHTGEKPFKCPHQGCGKAFSVRSNMKRHERGCHSFEGGAMV